MITRTVVRSGGGGGSGGAKLPSTLLNLSGTIRGEAVDWSAGATCVAVVEMSGANPVSDIQISGGLWATAVGLEFRDGSGNKARYPYVWVGGDTLIIILATTVAGNMKLGLMREFEATGEEVEFDGTINSPVAFAISGVGEVKRVATFLGSPSTSLIKKVAGDPDSFALLRDVDWTNLADKDW